MRLEIDIDSEVYPELHAALSALKSTHARGERMRQLAAAGLVWEKVRLHGTAATVVPAVVPAVVPEERAEIVTRADVKPLPLSEPKPPPAPERRRKRPSRADVEQVMRELPVLMDVVADVRPLHEPHEHHDDSEAHEEPAPWAAMSAYPDDVAATGIDDEDAEIPDAALHVTALSHKPATRSRLMRMKERGLFKNG